MKYEEQLTAMLTKASWAQYLTEEHVAKVCGMVEPLSYADGDRIYELGGKDLGLFFILSGKVEVIKDYPDQPVKNIMTLGENSFFGEISMADGLPHSASVVARGSVEVARMGRQTYDLMLDTAPELAARLQQSLMTVMATRLRFITLEFVRQL